MDFFECIWEWCKLYDKFNAKFEKRLKDLQESFNVLIDSLPNDETKDKITEEVEDTEDMFDELDSDDDDEFCDQYSDDFDCDISVWLKKYPT